MNIGIFTDTYYPQISGVATSILTLERQLTKLGHHVYIFTSTDSQANVKLEEGKVFRFPSMNAFFCPGKTPCHLWSPPRIQTGSSARA